MPAVTVWVTGAALTVKSGAGAGLALKATAWITQSPVPFSAAVAWQLPATDVIWCSAPSPFGVVMFNRLKPVPAPEIALDTVAPATITSTGAAVVQTPVSARSPVPKPPAAVSTGLLMSRPRYSSICTSGDGAAWLKVTVTWLGVAPLSPAMFFA